MPQIPPPSMYARALNVALEQPAAEAGPALSKAFVACVEQAGGLESVAQTAHLSPAQVQRVSSPALLAGLLPLRDLLHELGLQLSFEAAAPAHPD
jgi:DNA-binding phage protein